MASLQKLRTNGKVKRRQWANVVDMPFPVVLPSHTGGELHFKPKLQLWQRTPKVFNSRTPFEFAGDDFAKAASKVASDSETRVNFLPPNSLGRLTVVDSLFVLLIMLANRLESILTIILVCLFVVGRVVFSPCLRSGVCPNFHRRVKVAIDSHCTEANRFGNFPIRCTTTTHQNTFRNIGGGHLLGHAA